MNCHVILREIYVNLNMYSPFRFDTNANVLVYWSVIFQPNYSRPRRSGDFAFYFKFATWKWKKITWILSDFREFLSDLAWIWIQTLRYGKLIGHPWHFGTADWKKKKRNHFYVKSLLAKIKASGSSGRYLLLRLETLKWTKMISRKIWWQKNLTFSHCVEHSRK